MKKVSVIGHFADGLNYYDGQTVKTRSLYQELCSQLGENEIVAFDTHGGIKTLIRSPILVASAFKKTQNVIMLPAHNGVRVFGRLLPFFKLFFKGRKIHYVVIGGWLPELAKKSKGIAKSLMKFDGIYVETNTMRLALVNQGFDNIYVVPNFKELTPICADEMIYSVGEPHKLCTFSRISEEKGI